MAQQPNRMPQYPTFHQYFAGLAWGGSGHLISHTLAMRGTRLIGASSEKAFEHAVRIDPANRDHTFFVNRIVAYAQPCEDDTHDWVDFAQLGITREENGAALYAQSSIAIPMGAGAPEAADSANAGPTYRPLRAYTPEIAEYREVPLVFNTNDSIKMCWLLAPNFPSGNHPITNLPGRAVTIEFQGFLVKTDLANRLNDQRRALYAEVR